MRILGFLFAALLLSTPALSDAIHNKQVFDPSIQIGESCSGTVIHSKRGQVTGNVSTIVLTAKHCVLDNSVDDTITVAKDVYNDTNRRIERKVYFTKYLGSSYKSDLALLRLKDQDTLFPTAIIAPKDIKLEFGQAVEVVGYPLGRSMTWTLGSLGFVEEIEAFKKLSNTTEYYRATPDVVGGSSGSPMFTKDTDGDYKLIGVLTGGIRIGTFMNYYTPIEEIVDYLDVASKTFDDPKDVEKEEQDKNKEQKK